uniref:Semialdehyde dehydrogenase dimerisation domain-containing protein n=1 Tax=Brassica campestris TaxID=3711 RepID=M4F9Y6_BRACM
MSFSYSLMIFGQQYAFNLFSLNAPITENGYNEEEMKLVKETRKIWNDTEVKVTATCIRVPVMRAHAESVNLQFDNPLDELLFLVIPPPKPLFVFVPSAELRRRFHYLSIPVRSAKPEPKSSIFIITIDVNHMKVKFTFLPQTPRLPMSISE